MPTMYQPRHLVFPKMEIVDPAGNVVASIDQGSYSPGYDFWSKPESVPRPKPKDLRSNAAMTPWGGCSDTRHIRVPVSWSDPAGGGWRYNYKDMDPNNYATVGQALPFPEIDWQTALRLAIKDQQVNGVVAMAEAGKTMNMVTSNATTIYKVLRGLRRGDINSVFEILKIKRKKLPTTIGGRWLELRYGWMPLLQDLHGAVEELKRNFEVPNYRVIKFRKKSSERDFSRSGPYARQKSCDSSVQRRNVGSGNCLLCTREFYTHAFRSYESCGCCLGTCTLLICSRLVYSNWRLAFSH